MGSHLSCWVYHLGDIPEYLQGNLEYNNLAEIPSRLEIHSTSLCSFIGSPGLRELKSGTYSLGIHSKWPQFRIRRSTHHHTRQRADDYKPRRTESWSWSGKMIMKKTNKRRQVLNRHHTYRPWWPCREHPPREQTNCWWLASTKRGQTINPTLTNTRVELNKRSL